MKNLLLLFATGLLFSGCGHKDTYPDVPTLEFKSMVFGNDQGFKTAKLTATFTDGDGDIGYYQDRPNDTIFDSRYSPYYFNFVFRLQVYSNGNWIDTTIIDYIDAGDTSTTADDDTLFYNEKASYRLPYLTPSGQNKGLKGDIDKTNYLPAVQDTIRFIVFIYDRALHKSNEIITPGYYVTNP